MTQVPSNLHAVARSHNSVQVVVCLATSAVERECTELSSILLCCTVAGVSFILCSMRVALQEDGLWLQHTMAEPFLDVVTSVH